MTSEIQTRIDELGERLQRSVVINDREVRMLYSSRHFGDEDGVRIRAALHRDAGSRAVAHFMAHSGHEGTAPRRIPALEDLGLVERVVVPVRWHGELLGSVVLIDADASLTDQEIASVEDFARDAAGLIVAERHEADQQALADESDVRAWLAVDEGLRETSRASLVMRGLLPGLDHVRVAAVTTGARAGVDTRHVQHALRHALGAARGKLRGSTLTVVDATEGLIAFVSPVAVGDDRLTTVAEVIRREVRDFTDRDDVVRIGLGGEVASIDDAWRSRSQAQVALRMTLTAGFGETAWWDRLGVYQVLGRIPTHGLDESAVPESVRALLRADRKGWLTSTLEGYLRNGGASSATATALHIHRTTLYYRLDRVREITGLDVDDGDCRLELQLGLALHRMLSAAEHPAEAAGADLRSERT